MAILHPLLQKQDSGEKYLLLLLNGNRIVRAFVDTSSAVKTFLDVNHGYIVASDCTLRASVHARTARYTLFIVDLGWHQSTSGCPVVFLSKSLDINVVDRNLSS
jgi:hypothetical protein